ncbi:MAG: hypothetical protein ABIA37_03755 [Candidatus Woesearchaeota archaeon]
MKGMRSFAGFLCSLLEHQDYTSKDKTSLYLLRNDLRFHINSLNEAAAAEQAPSALVEIVRELNDRYQNSPLYVKGKAYKLEPSQQ